MNNASALFIVAVKMERLWKNWNLRSVMETCM